MQIDQDFEARRGSPIQGLLQDVVCTLDVGISVEWRNRPVPNWDTDVVHAGSGDLLEIIFGDPTVPVAGQAGVCFVLPESLAVGIF